MPLAWSWRSLPVPVSLMKMLELVEESASADEGARETKEPREDPATQENLPVVTLYWRRLAPLQVEVNPEPKVCEAEAKPDVQRLPETEAPASKKARPSTSSFPPSKRSEAVVKEWVVVEEPKRL